MIKINMNGRQLLRSKFLLLLLLQILLTSCAMAPRKYEGLAEGHWTGKALVKDKKKFKSHIVNLDFKAKDEALRADVTSPIGSHLASFVVTQDRIKFLLVKSKKFYKGRSHSKVLRKLLKVSLDPKWLKDILFDRSINEKSWVCEKDKDGYISKCSNEKEQLNVTWKDRLADKKTIVLESKKAEVQILLSSFDERIEDKKGLFDLKAPKNFKVYRLR